MHPLDALKEFTTVVTDSDDIHAVLAYQPHDATLTPSLILKAATLPDYQPLIAEAIQYASLQGGNRETRIINASDRLAVNAGVEILKHIPGGVSAGIDPRLSFNRGLCVSRAEKLVKMYEEQGIDRSRLLITLAATWEGIKAAETLEQNGIRCNLTLLFSFAQARACAEAGVCLISPPVGPVCDWYQSRYPDSSYVAENDPGVKSVRAIYDYYKKHRYMTIVMATGFRQPEQVLALAGCDRLAVSPELLRALKDSESTIERQLIPSTEAFHQPAPLAEDEFRWLHNQEAMAVEKLAEGIRQLAIDQQKLEDMLAARL